MKTISSKSVIWKNNTALRLLLFFIENPTKELYEKEVSEKTKISLGATNKYLKILAEEGYLLREQKGKMNFYRLNRTNVTKFLKISYTLSKPFVSDLQKVGDRFDVKMFLYGSVARGEDDENSDVDILILGKPRVELQKEILKIKRKYDVRLKLNIFSQREWSKMHESDPAFYERVEKDKIELV